MQPRRRGRPRKGLGLSGKLLLIADHRLCDDRRGAGVRALGLELSQELADGTARGGADCRA